LDQNPRFSITIPDKGLPRRWCGGW